MKIVIKLLSLACSISILYGLYLTEWLVSSQGHFYIGVGMVGLFFIVMPLFLIKYSKGKKLEDYMFNEQNIKKMNAFQEESSLRKKKEQ